MGAGAPAVVGPLVAGLMYTAAILAQSPASDHYAFDVASVKQIKPNDAAELRFPAFDGTRFVSAAPLFIVIATAYRLPLNPSPRLTGAPDWIDGPDGVYDIEATAHIPPGLSSSARGERFRRMLQDLLAERFKLVMHRETKEMPVYEIVVAKGGRKLEKSRVEDKDCPDAFSPGVIPCHQFNGGQGRGIHAQAVTIADLANFVENWAGRPVLDKTGIEGTYKIDTQPWIPMQIALNPPAPGTKGENGADFADLPTLFQVFEKLGLKLESAKDRVDVYIIDHIEKPSEN